MIGFSQQDKINAENRIKQHDEDKLKVTRTLQAQVDEKAEKIAKYQSKLTDLEQNSDKINEQSKEDYQKKLNDLIKKQDSEIYHTEHQMNELQEDLSQLDGFKKN